MMGAISGIVGARQALIRATDMGPIRATFHAPIFYIVAYRHAGSLVQIADERGLDAEPGGESR